MAEQMGSERLVDVPGRGLGAASEEVVRAGERRGYAVAASGPGMFRLLRSYRPRWAIGLAVVGTPFLGLGLLFLLIRRTDEGVVTVFEDRSGIKARIIGSIDEEIVQSLAAAPPTGGPCPTEPGHPPGPAAPVQAAAPVLVRAPAATPPAGVVPPAMVPTAPPPLASKHRRPPSPPAPTHRPTDPPPAATPQSPPAAVSGPTVRTVVDQPLQPLDDGLASTVVRPDRSAPTNGGVGIVLPDGRAVSLASAVVVGRAPKASPEHSPIQVQEPTMSKTHVSITPVDGGVEVIDVHSTNGTAVRHHGRLSECIPGAATFAPIGAEIVVGDAVLRVVGVG